MNHQPEKRIIEKCTIIVEGKNDLNILQKIVEKLGYSNDIKIISANGFEKIPAEMKAVLNSWTYDGQKSLGIIFDNDKKINNGKLRSIQNALKRCNLPSPKTILAKESNKDIRIVLFSCPGKELKGSMDTICLKSVEEEPVMNCVNEFFQCTKSKIKKISALRHEDKAKMQVYLSIKEEYCPNTGIAALKGYLSFGNKAFKELMQFVNLVYK